MATQIRICRESSFFAAMVTMEIVLDGEVVTTVKNGEELTIDVEKRPKRIAFLSTVPKEKGLVLQEVECSPEGDIFVEIGMNGKTGNLDILDGNVKFSNITEEAKYHKISMFLLKLALYCIILMLLITLYYMVNGML